MKRINVNDSVLLMSPHTDEHIIVSFRGEVGNGKGMAWTGKTQFAIPMDWLKLESEVPKLFKEAIKKELKWDAK